MSENPYQPPVTPIPGSGNRTSRKRFGTAAVVGAIFLLGGLSVGIWAFQRPFGTISRSPTTPRPAELAADIADSMLVVYPALFAALIGGIAMIVGIVGRFLSRDRG